MTTDGPTGHDLEGFTADARRALQLAEREARALGHAGVGTEHLLLGLLADKASPSAAALRGAGATLAAARRKVSEAVGPGAADTTDTTSSPRAARAIGRAPRLARDQQSDIVDSHHLLLAVLDVEGTAGQVLRGLSIDIEQLRATLGGKERPTPPAPTPDELTAEPTALAPQCPSCRAQLDAGVTGTVVPLAGLSGDGAGREVVVIACATCGHTLGVTPR